MTNKLSSCGTCGSKVEGKNSLLKWRNTNNVREMKRLIMKRGRKCENSTYVVSSMMAETISPSLALRALVALALETPA